MKKFFTMLGVAALTAIASQAEVTNYPGNPQFQGFKQNLAELMQPNQVSAIPDAQTQKRVIRREWESGNYTYYLTISKYDRLVDIVHFTLPDDKAATFEDMPYYIALMRIQRYRTQEPNKNPCDINLLMCWPCIASSNPSVDKGKNFPELTPENSVIAPVELVASRYNTSDAGFDTSFIAFNYPEGKYYANNFLPNFDAQGNFLGWPQMGNMAGAPITINGKDNYLVADNGGQHSNLKIISAKDNADLQNTNIKMEMNMYYAPQNDDSQVVGVTGTYDGLADTYNIQPFNAVYDINEFHIFNAGISKYDPDSENPEFLNPFGYPDVETFEPAQEYFVMALTAPATLAYNVKDYGEVKGFNGRQITYGFANEEDGLNPSNYRFIRGAFWTSGEEFQNRQYNVKEPEIYEQKYGQTTYELLCANPIPGIMLQGGYTTEFGYWPESAGTSMTWVAYNHFPNTKTYLAFNTKDGIVFDGKDDSGNTYNMAYKGKVIYHYDPENMNNTREEGPFVGTFEPKEPSAVNGILADSNFNITASNGVINVVSEGENIRVFDLSGALVGSAKGTASFNVNKGLYIVVVGKTAKKVIL